MFWSKFSLIGLVSSIRGDSIHLIRWIPTTSETIVKAFVAGTALEARPDRGGKLRTRKLRMQRKVKKQQNAPDALRDRVSVNGG